MSDAIITGIVSRALEFVLKDILPNAASLLPGPFGALLRAALGTPWAQQAETELAQKVANGAWAEISKIETACQAWAATEFKAHPEFKAFIDAVKPPAPTQFNLRDDELSALLAAQADGTLRAKLGLAS